MNNLKPPETLLRVGPIETKEGHMSKSMQKNYKTLIKWNSSRREAGLLALSVQIQNG